MAKSFIKFKPVTSYSEAHNLRLSRPKYLLENAEEKNENIVDEKIEVLRKKIEANCKEKTGRRMQSKAVPIREAVVLLPDGDNDKNLENIFALTQKLEEEYKIKAFQWHIHNDEGHKTKEGKNKYNYHAHILFDWTDHDTGKSLKLDKQDLVNIQTLTAEKLGMERGERGSKNLSLNHHQFRGYLEIKDRLELELKKTLSLEEQRQIRREIKEKELNQIRDESRGKNAGISR